MTASAEKLERRVAIVERQIERLLSPKILSAREFHLTDAAGTVRAVLGLNPEGHPQLVFRNKEGADILKIEMSDAWGNGLRITEADGTERVRFVVSREATSTQILGPGGFHGPSLEITTNKESAYLSLNTNLDVNSALLAVEVDQEPELSLYGSTGGLLLGSGDVKTSGGKWTTTPVASVSFMNARGELLRSLSERPAAEPTPPTSSPP